MTTPFHILQQQADMLLQQSEQTNDWNRPILNRIGDIVSVIVVPTKLRVTDVHITGLQPDRLELKVTGISVVTLVIAPAEQLAAELFVFKAAAVKRLPMPHVIKADVSYANLPVAYALYGFVAGMMLADVSDETLIRIAARQYGRAIKTLHTSEAPGFGSPQPTGVWSSQSWSAALEGWFTQSFGGEALRGILGRNVLQSFYAATTQSYADRSACCLVGAVGPQLARATIHSHIQVEGIVRTGRVVAGDPMFDVAATMRQDVPVPFRQGFIEGYTLNTPLTDDERDRIKCYTLLWRVYELIERTQADPGADTAPVAQSVVAAVTQLLASRPNDRPR